MKQFSTCNWYLTANGREILSKSSRDSILYLAVWCAGYLHISVLWVLAIHWIQTILLVFLQERQGHLSREQKTDIFDPHHTSSANQLPRIVLRCGKCRPLVSAVLLFWLLAFVSLHFQSPAKLSDQNFPVSSDVLQPIRLSDSIREFSASTVHKRHSVYSQVSKNCMNLDSERLRRRADETLQELWYYLRAFLDTLIKHLPDDKKNFIDDGRRAIKNHHHVISAYLYELSLADGLDHVRQAEAQALERIVQNRFHYLQNPSNCATAKRIVCNGDSGCGYGCALHNIVYCFSMAYGLQRTMVLKQDRMGYVGYAWNTHFLPVSNNCSTVEGADFTLLTGPDQSDLVVFLQAEHLMTYKPDFLPLAIPEDLAPRLNLIFKDPGVWWLGQIIKYLTRPREKWREQLLQRRALMNFTGPIVGVHVRRTDKVGTEAAFHDLSEYMEFVDDYYDRLEKVQGYQAEKKIYLASEDASVYMEAKTKYPHYIILGEPDRTGAAMNQRNSETALPAILMDIYFLSNSDYIVCTFSSNVCRLAFAEMQTYRADASSSFHSLDDIYYFTGQQRHEKQAVYSHYARDNSEISIRVLDYITIAGNHWNGLSKGTNERTQMQGLFPSYKVQDVIVEASMPIYKEADEQLKMSTIS